jgi:DnaJ-class molecular chaperone
MMDYYSTLGVDRNASPDDIKKAYRKMAAKYHPDREGGSTAEFQKIEEAYRILSDPQQRQQHDNPHPFGGGDNPFGSFHFNFGGGNPFEDIINQFHRQARQRIYTVTLSLTLEQVAMGSTETIQLGTPQGVKTFQIKVPQAVEHGQQVRYEGLMQDGVLQIQFLVTPHPLFERRGLDLHTTKKISIYDLLLGTTIKVTTIWGDELEATVPPRTTPGATLRVAGKGLERNGVRAHQYILLSAEMPSTISTELLALLEAERKNQGAV